MRKLPFVPLRLHSVFSRGRGAATLEELASWSERQKLPAAGLSDIESLHGWARWKQLASLHGFKPLFGCELERQKHLFLFLVKNRKGYWNLMEILNQPEKEIATWSVEGLIIIYLPSPKDRAGSIELNHLKEGGADLLVGADFFNYGQARAIAQEQSLSLVWASPLKYLGNPERLLLLHAIEKKVPFPPEKEKWASTIALFGPNQSLLAWRRFGPEILPLFEQTLAISERCEFILEAIVPPLSSDIFPFTLRQVVMDRLRQKRQLSWKERERVKVELEAIEQAGFAPYFLLVYDVVDFARRRGILHNLKGSGASSYLAYLLGLSQVNPLDFDLYFERFLNRGRQEPPDIDLDFDSRYRDEVLRYVLEKYGQGKTGVAFVCSLKNYRARSALYETARAFGVAPEEARGFCRSVPLFAEPEYLKKMRPVTGYEEVWRLAAELQGVLAEKSLHVGGVILTPSPVARYLPLEDSAKGFPMSHYDREAVEELKLIKLDLLSVRGLAAISATKAKMRLQSLPQDDPKVYQLLSEGPPIGCFQVESPAMMNLLRRMKPKNIHELTQALALIRPGPTESGMKEALLRQREGKKIRQEPLLSQILPETGGLLLYEEQIMQLAERVAGLSPAEGDLLRRSLKKREALDWKTKFFQGAKERGYSEEEIERLWTTMQKFSAYAFNKAHSASYAVMAYQAVYLKAHYPLVYFTSVLNAGGGYYSLGEYVEEAKRWGLRFLPPDINRSDSLFKVEGQAIRIGLTLIKGLGPKTVAKILEERKNGPFLSIEDFLGRVRPGKTELLALIKAGAFDSLRPQRSHQILHYFQGIEDVSPPTDLEEREKQKMLLDVLGFSPGAHPLLLFDGPRPEIRIAELGQYIGQTVEFLVCVVDARLKEANGRPQYFFLFEDETGLLEGVGEKPCLSFGQPPLAYLRAEIKPDRSGHLRAFNCTFLPPG
ncbi:MAG: DNA polymerase III subunit alpha [Candidatus Aminicenantes bacterium]|nr:DNA polymerase III subunit alpha [Candidatus Aminicenantes bacterium]